MLTVPVEGVGAVQIARSARETERALDVIRTRTWLSVALVVAAAAIAGWLIGRQVTRRLVRLTQAADDVATTGRLDLAVPVSGSDETGRLGLAFNGCSARWRAAAISSTNSCRMPATSCVRR